MNWQSVLTGTLGCCGFALLYRIPLKRLPLAVLGGALGTLSLLLFQKITDSLFTSNLLAAIVAAIYCEVTARILRTPVTLFMLPALVPLAPGSYLYYATFYFVQRDMGRCLSYALGTFSVASGLAVGIVTVSLIIRVIKIPKLQRHLHK